MESTRSESFALSEKIVAINFLLSNIQNLERKHRVYRLFFETKLTP